MALDDSVTFDPDTLTTVPIRQDDECHGPRLAMNATLSRARLKLHLDVSFGDPVTPAPAPLHAGEIRGFSLVLWFILSGAKIATCTWILRSDGTAA